MNNIVTSLTTQNAARERPSLSCLVSERCGNFGAQPRHVGVFCLGGLAMSTEELHSRAEVLRDCVAFLRERSVGQYSRSDGWVKSAERAAARDEKRASSPETMKNLLGSLTSNVDKDQGSQGGLQEVIISYEAVYATVRGEQISLLSDDDLEIAAVGVIQHGIGKVSLGHIRVPLVEACIKTLTGEALRFGFRQNEELEAASDVAGRVSEAARILGVDPREFAEYSFGLVSSAWHVWHCPKGSFDHCRGSGGAMMVTVLADALSGDRRTDGEWWGPPVQNMACAHVLSQLVAGRRTELARALCMWPAMFSRPHGSYSLVTVRSIYVARFFESGLGVSPCHLRQAAESTEEYQRYLRVHRDVLYGNEMEGYMSDVLGGRCINIIFAMHCSGVTKAAEIIALGMRGNVLIALQLGEARLAAGAVLSYLAPYGIVRWGFADRVMKLPQQFRSAIDELTDGIEEPTRDTMRSSTGYTNELKAAICQRDLGCENHCVCGGCIGDWSGELSSVNIACYMYGAWIGAYASFDVRWASCAVRRGLRVMLALAEAGLDYINYARYLDAEFARVKAMESSNGEPLNWG